MASNIELFAAKIRAHVSTLASTDMKLSLIEWNEIANDLLDAADRLQGAPDDKTND